MKIDFRCGVRMQIPAGIWHVRLSHNDTGQIFLDEDLQEIILVSQEKYFIPWKIEVFCNQKKIFEHVFDPKGQHIHVVEISECIGDTIAFLVGIRSFQKQYQVELSLYVRERMQDFVKEWYPDIKQCERWPEDTYAIFFLGGAISNRQWIPLNGKMIPLQAFSQYVMGLDSMPGRVAWQPRHKRLIKEPYVCIAVQASVTAKAWLWPNGWDEIVIYLKMMGYRVLCIDKDKERTDNGYCVRIPEGAEDFTGNRPLTERADMLAYADFFIGLGSGLSWIAWIAGCPVIMIAGFSAVWYEFPEAYRVFNPMVCHGCFNDLQVDYLNGPCQRYAHDEEHYLECQRMISPSMVKRAIDRCYQDIQRNKCGKM